MTYDENGECTDNIIEKGEEKSLILGITIAGVPKKGAKALKTIEDFRDDFVFEYKYTNKNLIVYVEDMKPFELTDYNGVKYTVTDVSGCCLLPTTYVLGKSEDYAKLLIDNSSARAIYKE